MTIVPSGDWSEAYATLVDRNLGLITSDQQEKLRQSTVAVAGVGGLGSVVFEVLVRAGVGHLAIADNDTVDASNMNRHVFATRQTVGHRKVDVASAWARSVNPGIHLRSFSRLDPDVVGDLLSGADVVVNCIDELEATLVVARRAREADIPLVDGWAIPFGNVRVISSETPSLEQAYGLPTEGRPLDGYEDGELRQLGVATMLSLGRISGLGGYYSNEALMRIAEGKISSFAPMVWLTAVLMANEAIKVVLQWGRIAYGPKFTLYDPYQHSRPVHGDAMDDQRELDLPTLD